MRAIRTWGLRAFALAAGVVASALPLLPASTALAQTATSTPTATPTPGNAAVSVVPSTTTVVPGQLFSVQVNVSLTGANSRGWQFGFTFDPTLVQVRSVVRGTW